MSFVKSTRTQIIKDRLLFFAEVFIVFLGIFFLLLIPRLLLPLILEESSVYYEPVFYLIRAIIIVVAIPLSLFISSIALESQKKDMILEEDISPSKGHIMLYKISRSNAKYQVLYGLLIYFLIFLPFDFFTYLLIPEMLQYQADALTLGVSESYFLQAYLVFLVLVLIMQISVSFYEESLTRGFLAKRGADNFNKMSAVIMSSFYFGLMHFAYIFSPVSASYPLWFPFVWYVEGFIIGILLSMFVTNKKWLFPVIFAHAINNIVSAHVIWNHLQGNTFMAFAVQVYMPLLICGLGLFLLQFRNIKEGVMSGLRDFKDYLQIDDKIGESKGDMYVRIIFDFLIGLLIFVIGFFVFAV